MLEERVGRGGVEEEATAAAGGGSVDRTRVAHASLLSLFSPPPLGPPRAPFLRPPTHPHAWQHPPPTHRATPPCIPRSAFPPRPCCRRPRRPRAPARRPRPPSPRAPPGLTPSTWPFWTAWLSLGELEIGRGREGEAARRGARLCAPIVRESARGEAPLLRPCARALRLCPLRGSTSLVHAAALGVGPGACGGVQGRWLSLRQQGAHTATRRLPSASERALFLPPFFFLETDGHFLSVGNRLCPTLPGQDAAPPHHPLHGVRS